MIVVKWHVRRTSGAPKALVVALSFLPLAWAGMPKTSFRKNSDSRILAFNSNAASAAAVSVTNFATAEFRDAYGSPLEAIVSLSFSSSI